MKRLILALALATPTLAAEPQDTIATRAIMSAYTQRDCQHGACDKLAAYPRVKAAWMALTAPPVAPKPVPPVVPPVVMIPAPAPPVVTPMPMPVPMPVPVPVPAGYAIPAAIADTLDFNAETVPTWGTGVLPQTAAPDVVGAFRFTCTAGQVLADDPVVYPGQPGASHLHQFFGNTAVNANTTYATLRATGDSTCGSALNRSGYWQPAMVARDGSVLKPDAWAIYYKRAPAGSAECLRRAKSCVPIPTGIRFIYGYDMITSTPATGSIKWLCSQNNGNTVREAPTMTGALAGCPNGAQLEARLEAPDCWDGVNVDSANHRSHVSYGTYGDRGYQCPSTHPVNIPQFTNGSIWTVTDALRTASLSSDMGKPQGTTFHADYFEGWSPVAKAVWEANCINGLKNASGGDLCNGRQLRGQ